MTDVGDDAPTFTASLVTDEIEPFDLADRLGDEPVVLAFFPAAFSNTCTDEMEALRDGFDRDDCVLLGVSTDLPHALAAYRTQYDLPFGLVADVVLEPGVEPTAALREELRDLIGAEHGKPFRPREVLFVDAFPKTQSGKVIRRAIAAVHRGDDPGDLSSMENPEALEGLRDPE